MKKQNLEKVRVQRSPFRGRLLAPFERLFRIMKVDSESESNSSVSMQMAPNRFMPFEEMQEIRCHVLKMEMKKAEAIEQIRRRIL